MQIQELVIDKIYIPDKHIRTPKNGRELAELKQSLAENGLEVEIRVYQTAGENYVLIAGSRRLQAAKELGWPTIRAVVEPAPEDVVEYIIHSALENTHRKPLSYGDYARIYALLEDNGMSRKDIATRFKVSEAQLSQALSVRNAHPKVLQAINNNELSPSAAELLSSLSQDEQGKLVDAAIKARTVRNVSALVKAHKKRENAGKATLKAATPITADPLQLMAVQTLRTAVDYARQAVQHKLTEEALLKEAIPLAQGLASYAEQMLYEINEELLLLQEG